MRMSKYQILEGVLKIVSNYTGVSIELIKSKSRVSMVSDARRIFCAIMDVNKHIGFSLNEIGSHVGTDHCLVIYSRKKVADLCFSDFDFRNTYSSISKEVSIFLESQPEETEFSKNDVKEIIELLYAKIELLENWLINHPNNSLRVKIQNDKKHFERELEIKKTKLETV
jgi:hypothetical protein